MIFIQNINIIPKPVKTKISNGKFVLTDNTIILTRKNLLNIGEYLKNLILPSTGFNLKFKELNEITAFNEKSINLQLLEDKNKHNFEKYFLSITPKNINISATTPNGIFYGIQTIRQLFPPEIESDNIIENVEWKIPCLDVEDFPRFSWRGYMLDEARYFYGKDEVKQLLDLMALFKMNTFHWHLTDDQGWRIEIKKYPKLTEIGSKREESQIGGYFSKKKDGIPHLGYYSKEDIQEIIIYAKERFITIMPEIDMPGHTRAALASYPNLSCKGYDFKVSPHWGIHKDVFCIGKEEVFEFAQDVLNEIMDLFPSKIIHIGGDEVLKTRWENCPECQLRIESEVLKDEKELQIYFTNRVTSFLASNKRKVIVWNDIIEDGLDKNIICQFWFPSSMKIHIEKIQSRKVVMSNYEYVYLDRPYIFTSLKKAYNYEPMVKKLKEEYQSQVLGLEACMWGELVPNTKILEFQTFPRLIAFAETGWSPKSKKNFTSFQQRLKYILQRLDIKNIKYAKNNVAQPKLFKKFSHLFSFWKEKLIVSNIKAVHRKKI
ncbi:MAG: beta-N-acetylhexosaminidase [Promethearchaeota archaeon]